jgi:hypothetical protein
MTQYARAGIVVQPNRLAQWGERQDVGMQRALRIETARVAAIQFPGQHTGSAPFLPTTKHLTGLERFPSHIDAAQRSERGRGKLPVVHATLLDSKSDGLVF